MTIPSVSTSGGITEPSIATSFPQNADPYGTRKWLYEHGVSYNFIYTNDVLSNLSGGIRRGTIDQGKLEGQLYIDLDKLAGWKDWTFYANAFGIYNDGRIRRDYVGGMNTIAAIEATPTVRLSELWLERWFGPVSLRFGHLAADAEFFYSDVSQIFLWDLETGVEVRRMPLPHLDGWNGIAFSSDGRSLISGPHPVEPPAKGHFLFWEVATGKLRGKVFAQTAPGNVFLYDPQQTGCINAGDKFIR